MKRLATTLPQELAVAEPDKEKLMAFAAHVSSLLVPVIKDEAVFNAIHDRLNDLQAWLEKQAEAL